MPYARRTHVPAEASKEKVETVSKRRMIRLSKFWVSYEEIYNIAVALVLTALILAYDWVDPAQTITQLPSALFAVLIAFMFQLPAQKWMAHKLNCSAVYKLWLPGLVMSMFLILIGIKVVLVGAIMVGAYEFGRFGFKAKYASMIEIGWMGMIGPLMNIASAALFIYLASVFTDYSSALYYIGFINGLIAVFNLAPINPMDGGKMMLWSPLYWVLFVIILVVMLTPYGLINYIFVMLPTLAKGVTFEDIVRGLMS